MTQSSLHSQEYNIRLKKGLRANLDVLATGNAGVQGEPAYTTNDKQFFIHDGTRFLPPNFEMSVSYENVGIFYEGEAVIYY